jgi:L-threonylcarbamoyladenylate synthase
MTTLARIDLRGDPDADLSPALEHLEAGLPLAYPTETVYGLGGAVTPEAVEGVRRLKGRDAARPMLLLIENPAAVPSLRWTPHARELAKAFWPGALTLVLEDQDRIFPGGVRSEATGGVGVRVSPHPLVRRILDAFGRPLTSTSLNVPGQAPASSGTEAAEVAERLGHGPILLLDAGTLPPSKPSTVVDCTGPIPVVLREGSIPVGRLRCVIPEIHERSQV